MKSYQERVVQELDELETKIRGLIGFIGNDTLWDKVDPVEQDRLIRQYAIMVDYSDILNERIQAFE